MIDEEESVWDENSPFTWQELIETTHNKLDRDSPLHHFICGHLLPDERQWMTPRHAYGWMMTLATRPYEGVYTNLDKASASFESDRPGYPFKQFLEDLPMIQAAWELGHLGRVRG